MEECKNHNYITTQKGRFVCIDCGHERISTRKTKSPAKIFSVLFICVIISAGFYYANTSQMAQKFLNLVSERASDTSQQIQKEATTLANNSNAPSNAETVNNATSQINSGKTIQKQQISQSSISPIKSIYHNGNTGQVPIPVISTTQSTTLAELRNYALQLINNDRTSHGLLPVALSNNQAAQAQAEDMLNMQTLSHYMSDGEKPYMVYTKYGGFGNVAQNAADSKYDNTSLCQSVLVICPALDPKTEIQNSESSMMNNDLICCNNGHRDNILDKYHTAVSIGIAYTKYSFFMTQNFENNYLSFTKSPSENNGIVTFAGNLKTGSLLSIGIFYDPLPTKQTYEVHKNDGFYKLGNELGTIVQPPVTGSYYQPSNETLEIANRMVQMGNYVDTSFDLSPFVTQGGVYTMVAFLQDGAEQFPITSYSITKTTPMVQDGFKSPKVNYACTQNQIGQYDTLQQQFNALEKQYNGMPKIAISQQEYQQDLQMYSQLDSLQKQMQNFKC
ncbi:CAP domain-containing protein [Candidatus Nitrosotalea bavarica]|uniref:CAP domain-containing protein n=1 Tax=Candidatus Nitrosotalea bavarica TaxID=1903277 RepID=UPI000C70EBD0|nr:CAP domain-containing protein [Candidatus Nitrosotalea bavarica]